MDAGALESESHLGQNHLGRPHTRVEGFDKVTGRARYSSDHVGADTAHAALVTSTIARGRITGFDCAAAEGVPGLLGIFTHREFAGAVAPVDVATTAQAARATRVFLSIGSPAARGWTGRAGRPAGARRSSADPALALRRIRKD